MLTVSLIVAMSANRVIGVDGGMPWHLSDDLRRFKRLTLGHHVLMGRRTFDSIGRPLPDRTNLVLSRRAAAIPGVTVVGSFDEALRCAHDAGDDELFVAGGGEVYRMTLPYVHRAYLTIVHTTVEGDVTFPEIDFDRGWTVIEEIDHVADDRHAHAFTFRTLERSSDESS